MNLFVSLTPVVLIACFMLWFALLFSNLLYESWFPLVFSLVLATMWVCQLVADPLSPVAFCLLLLDLILWGLMAVIYTWERVHDKFQRRKEEWQVHDIAAQVKEPSCPQSPAPGTSYSCSCSRQHGLLQASPRETSFRKIIELNLSVKNAAELALVLFEPCRVSLKMAGRNPLTFKMDELHEALVSIRGRSEDLLRRGEMRLSSLDYDREVLSEACQCLPRVLRNRMDDGITVHFMQENFLSECLRILQARVSAAVKAEENFLR